MVRLYTFLIFSAIGIVFLYAVFVMPQPHYEGKISMLIVAKNTQTAVNLDYIINDIVFISQNALEDNKIVQEYDANVEMHRISKHNIVQLETKANSKKEVVDVEEGVTKEIVKNIGSYYQLNKDFTITIIDRTMPQQTILASLTPYVVMVSVAIGLIAGVLALFDIFGNRHEEEYDENMNGEKIFARYKTRLFEKHNDLQNVDNVVKTMDSFDNEIDSKEHSDEVIEKQKKSLNEEEIVAEVTQKQTNNEIENSENENNIETQRDSEQSNLVVNANRTIEDEEYIGQAPPTSESSYIPKKEEIANSQETQISNTPQGLETTPGNLPVIDLDEIGFTGVTDNKKVCADVQDVQDEEEPTEEELKARLNELLNGKL